jgi:hypothetical protein
MSRGPYPGESLAAAVPIAEMRGTVHIVRHARGSLYDFVISTAVPVAFVRVKYTDWILMPLPEAEAYYRDVINGLRAIASTENVSRELWLRSRHGTWRFFRVTGNGLVELSRNGMIFNTPGKEKANSRQV